MPQSLVKNYLHIIFSTKLRRPIIYPPYDEKLYAYLGGICKNQECVPIQIGGYRDHVHILCLLSKKITLVKFMEDLKTHSSKYMKTLSPELKDFYWQDGYGAFSVNPSQVSIVRDYILHQEIHHQKKSFQKEYIDFLKKYQIEYDERYLWD
ncbi:MAG: IS200/IS605 family transposase [Algoriphagus sp.]|jgi:REP element-mobilizing transposase RayT|nr:IS200/IS605 family transposase [Algoriphagus sp.]